MKILKNKKSIFIVSALVIIAISTGWLATRYYLRHKIVGISSEEERKAENVIPMQSEGTIPVKIFYPSTEGIDVGEKLIRGNRLPVLMVEDIVKEFLKLLQGDMKNTNLLGVYRDRNNIVYIDLSDEFRRGFSGDARQEYYLLKSLYDTIITNVTETEDVKLLIEGREIESIGGHFYIVYGLKGLFVKNKE